MIDLLLDLEDNLVKLISSKNIEEQQAGLTFLEAVLESCDSIKDENLLKLLSKLAYGKFKAICRLRCQKVCYLYKYWTEKFVSTPTNCEKSKLLDILALC